MKTASFEEYESCVETPEPLNSRTVSLYEAEGWGVVESRSDDIFVKHKLERFPYGHFLDEFSINPLLHAGTYGREKQSNHEYGEMARMENEIQMIDEELDMYISEINNIFLPHDYLSSSPDSEMQEALMSIVAKVGELRQCCDAFAEKQPFISEETVCHAINQTEIIKACFDMVAAAESINNLYKTRLNTFLPRFETDAVKHSNLVSSMLDDIEKVVDILESDVRDLRDKSVEAVKTLRCSLDNV